MTCGLFKQLNVKRYALSACMPALLSIDISSSMGQKLWHHAKTEDTVEGWSSWVKWVQQLASLGVPYCHMECTASSHVFRTQPLWQVWQRDSQPSVHRCIMICTVRVHHLWIVVLVCEFQMMVGQMLDLNLQLKSALRHWYLYDLLWTCGARGRCLKEHMYCILDGSGVVPHTVNRFYGLEWTQMVMCDVTKGAGKECSNQHSTDVVLANLSVGG